MNRKPFTDVEGTLKGMGPHLFSSILIPFVVGVGLANCWAQHTDEEIPGFNQEVRPILSRCLPCHGPDANSRKAGLALHHAEGATAQRRGGPAIVVGNAEESSLFARVASTNPELRMPPPGAGEPITAEELDILKRWINGGAQYDTHWSFTPPQQAIPAEDISGWAEVPLDHVVAAKHQAMGIAPAPKADRYTLARRASLDLLGVPPTPEDVDAFCADTRPDAFEHYVEALLASPAFGERWARVWLDVARYADTKGYEQDGNRTIWPWRDWVIRAFNADMPFDDFTIEQLAGDLLPDPTDEQLLATAFHRNTMTNDEGGTRDEEFRMAAVIDRTNTTMETWMGLSAGCAQCHDHKYDPISQEEYYQLLAIFNTTQDADRNDESPVIAVIDHTLRSRMASLKEERLALARLLSNEGAEFQATPIPPPTSSRGTLPLLDDVVPPGATPRGNAEPKPFPWRGPDTTPAPASGIRLRASIAPANQFIQHYFDDAAPGASITLIEGDQLYAWVWIDPEHPPTEIMLQWHAPRGGWDHRAVWGTSAIALGVEDTPSKRRLGALPEAGQWHQLLIDPATIDLNPGDEATKPCF